MPHVGAPDDIRESLDPEQRGYILSAPKNGYAADVAFFVCEGRPWWYDEDKSRAKNACLGPLTTGGRRPLYLTAMSARHRTTTVLSPIAANRPRADSPEDRTRAVGTAVDDVGVRWVVEQITSRTNLIAQDRAQGRRHQRSIPEPDIAVARVPTSGTSTGRVGERTTEPVETAILTVPIDPSGGLSR